MFHGEDSPPDPRDDDLVAMCHRGERQAFDVLVRRYMHRAYQIALDFTHDGEEAKDLSQEAFLRAFMQIKHFDRRSSFYTWFYRIVVNLCLDHHRRRGRFLRNGSMGEIRNPLRKRKWPARLLPRTRKQWQGR